MRENIYHFIERNSGEEFLVGCSTLAEAKAIANSIFEAEVEADIKCYGRISEYEAEISGLDQY